MKAWLRTLLAAPPLLADLAPPWGGASATSGEGPFRAELFTADQMERHGRHLAETHESVLTRHSDRLLPRLADNRRTLLAVCGRLAEGSGPLPERPDPQRTSVVAGTRLDLLDALERLGPQLAEPVALRDVIGLSYAEIATCLDVAEGTVKSRIHEGRRRLRERLDDERSDLHHRANK